jgi:hypothetical protein
MGGMVTGSGDQGHGDGQVDPECRGRYRDHPDLAEGGVYMSSSPICD